MTEFLVARAPGKIVISGAYAVLAGAPAIVAAVDRYAIARANAEPTFHSAEVLAALAQLGQEFTDPHRSKLCHPFVDADALREGSGATSRKLGLGSSAAILVSSLALVLARLRGKPAAEDEIWSRALLAHRRAQGGGSGVDVNAATYGGIRVFQKRPYTLVGAPVEPEKGDLNDEAVSHPVVLPNALRLEVWSVPQPANTQDFVRQVFALRQRDPTGFQHTLGAQCLASFEAERALLAGSAADFIETLTAQADVLTRLGRLAGVPIFLPELIPLTEHLGQDQAWLPAGAGGGDIMLYAGLSDSPEGFRKAALNLGLTRLELTLGARGVHLL
jgi:phosphomevalonate kinase